MLTLKPIVKYGLDLKIVLVAVLYFLSARLGYYLVFDNTNILPTWPPSGFALALLLMLGRRVWPGVTIGALLANIMAYWNTGQMATDTIIVLSLVIAVGHTFEALFGNFLIRKLITDRYPFNYTKNAFRFLLISCLVALLSASIGVTGLYLNNVVEGDAYLRYFIFWWVGNVVGILLFTPFLLSFRGKVTYDFSKDKVVEMTIFLGLVIGVAILLRVDYMWATVERAIPFLTFPFLLWLAFRFKLVVALSGVVVASLIAIYFTINYMGPFVLDDSYTSMLLLQIFIGVISISTIILSTTVRERASAQLDLQLFNQKLESMVKDRTHELEEQIETRKQAEEKMQKSNDELRKINTELDNFVYSVSHDLRAPIASTLGVINLAKKDNDLKMKNTYLDMVQRSALQQDEFIKEILDQSRNSRLELRREEVQFDELIHETFDQLKFANPNDDIQKEIMVEQDGPFISDNWRVKVIFNNLISNAIRYRNGKSPVIHVDVKVNGEKANIAIKDNGRGIAEEHLDKIYDMFYRATDDNAGSGLGLYIVKEIIDKLQGKISIDSKVGEGTTVKLEIPTAHL